MLKGGGEEIKMGAKKEEKERDKAKGERGKEKEEGIYRVKE